MLLVVGTTMPMTMTLAGAGIHDRMAVETAGTHERLHEEPDSSHDERPGHGVLHCPSFQCVTPFLVQMSTAWRRIVNSLTAFGPVRSDGMLLQAILERDPPVPRISI